jgi:hypothetical protein
MKYECAKSVKVQQLLLRVYLSVCISFKWREREREREREERERREIDRELSRSPVKIDLS